jgi:DNA replication ATP-dependent helicase Dna2
MIMKRNELACFVRERLKLPPMLPESRQRLCNNCYAQTTCFLYHKLAEDGTSATITNKGKFEELVRYLTPVDETFFKKWDHLLTKEESEMKKFTRELWTMLSTEREKLGRCFSNVVLVPGSAHEIQAASKINRFQYTFIKQSAPAGFSFTESQITVGEPIVISDEQGHYALANGYVTSVNKRKISVAVDRGLNNSRKRRSGFHSQNNQDFTGTLAPFNASKDAPLSQNHDDDEPMLYRLDKDEFSNGMATARSNMLAIMDDTRFKATSLRSMIVQGRAPTFKPASSALPLRSQAWETEMNSDQKAAVEKVMAAQDYALVLGMPGTGKTTTIAHIIRALVAKGKSVLLTSYTHTAVDNILLKVRHAGFDILRLGVQAKIHPEVQEFAILAAQPKSSLEELENSWYKPPVVATTCLSVNHALFTKRTFDYCIVDEASQITLPVCLGPIRLAKTFVLVGDHFQLPPLVQNKEACEGGLDISLFKLLSENHSEAVVNLEHQYRMCADVMLLSNRLIYSGRLKCGNEAVATRSLQIPDIDALKKHHCPGTSSQLSATSTPRSCRGPTSPNCHLAHALNPKNKVLFFNTDTLLPHSAEMISGPRVTNAVEATLTTHFVHALLSAGIFASEVGVITFYRSQLALLRQNLRSAPGIELHTADKFQGRDKEAVIVSFVRSNTDGSVGELLKDWRRINVAVTRARSKLILIGSKKTLLQGGDVLRGLVEICDEKSWTRDFATGAVEAHYFPEVGSQLDVTQGILSPTAQRKEGRRQEAKKSPRKALGEITGRNGAVGRVKTRTPEKKGRISQKAVLAGNAVLRDIMNELCQ